MNLFNCSLTQKANQPIAGQRVNAFKHLGVVKTRVWRVFGERQSWLRLAEIAGVNDGKYKKKKKSARLISSLSLKA